MRYKRWMVVSLASCVAIAAACVPKPGVPANAAPVATISATPDTGSAPLPVQYSAGGSVDPDGTIVDHLWTFGDGSDPVHGVDVMHTYEHEGTYTVILTVTDNRGAVGSAQFELTVNPRPPATLASQEQIILNPVGDPIAVYDTGPWDRYELREPGAVGYDPATDSWIALYTGRGNVVEGNSAVTASVGAVVSDDGENWVPHPQNPLTGVGGLGGVGQGEDPYLAKNPDGTIYRDGAGRALMFTEEKDFDVHRGILLWRSGVNTLEDWTLFGRVLDRGAAGTWSATDVTSPTVIHDGNRLVMLFEGRNMPAQQGEIGIAWSYDDGESFTVAAEPIVARGDQGGWNATAVVPDELVKVDDKWVLLVHAQGSGANFFPGRYLTTDDPAEWAAGSFTDPSGNPLTYQTDSVTAWGNDPGRVVGVSMDGQRFGRFVVERR